MINKGELLKVIRESGEDNRTPVQFVFTGAWGEYSSNATPEIGWNGHAVVIKFDCDLLSKVVTTMKAAETAEYAYRRGAGRAPRATLSP